jgi:hypothetical protein
MSNEEPLSTANNGIALIGEVIKAAGDSPQVKEAAGNLGETAVTLTKAINNVLVPLAAINFAFDKARAYVSGKFQQEIAEKAELFLRSTLSNQRHQSLDQLFKGLRFRTKSQISKRCT